MRWKKELVGAALALAVSVIAGLILWVVTQEPVADKKEVLYFQLDKPVEFSGREQRLSIGTFSFGNSGDVPAREVTATLTSVQARILEANINSYSGITSPPNISDAGTTATLSIPNLLPGDRVTVSYLLDAPGKTSLDVRSNSSKAITASQIAPAAGNTKRSRLNRFFELSWPLLFLVSFLPIWLISRQLKRARKQSRYRPENRNNNAFVLMHTGFPEDAKNLLRKSIESGRDGSFAMSNYAGACALLDLSDDAEKYINAAEFLAESDHEKSIVNLNRVIIAFMAGNKDAALQKMTQAVRQCDDDLRQYLEHSSLLQEICEWHPEIRLAIAAKSGKK